MKKIFFLISILVSFSSILSMEEKWVNLGLVSDASDTSGTVWRIKDEFLELNLKAKDRESGKSFDQLLQEAHKKRIPYILLDLYDKTNDSFEFVDGSYLLDLYNTTKSPTGKPFEQVEIFVAGDDGILTKISSVPEEHFKGTVEYYGFITDEQEVNQDLQKPGYGQLLIANILRKTAVYGESTQKKVDDINAQIESFEEEENVLEEEKSILEKEKGTAEEERVKEIDKQLEKLSKQKDDLTSKIDNLASEIDKLILEEGIPTPQMRQWFEWALKYLPKNSPEYEQATKELAEINAKLGKVVPEEPEEPEKPEKPVEDPQVAQKILQNLQNLTRSLEQLAATLT